MRRINKIKNPKMVSARVERTDVQQFEVLLEKQRYFSLQDVINFTVVQFISGNIFFTGSQIGMKEHKVDWDF